MITRLCYLLIGLVSIISCGGGGGGYGSGGDGEQLFVITIENTSTQALASNQLVVLSPTVVAVHSNTAPILSVGSAAGTELEAFAEAADQTPLLQKLSIADGVKLVGLAQTPVGETSPSLIGPGSRYAITISASPGDLVSLATCFAQANDTVVSNANTGGAALFDAEGSPLSGEIAMALYDTGTEVNETLAAGPNQVLRQETVTSGQQENNPVSVQSGGGFPAASSFIKVSFAPAG